MRHRTLLTALALLLAACGSEGTDATADTTAIPTPGLPATYTGPDGVTTTVESAARIVSLSGDYTEIVFALGLGPNVVGVDLSSVHPLEEVRPIPKVGVEFRLFTEPILDLEPTVVLGDIDASPSTVIDQLRSAGVPVVIFDRAAGITAPPRKIREVARVLGVPERGDALAARVEAEIADAAARTADVEDRPRVALVYVAGRGDTILLLGEGSVAEGVFEAIGAEDVAPEAGADGFVPLTAEALVAGDPEVIITAERGIADLGGMDEFLALPGVAQTTAGRNGAVLVYEDLYLLGLGPRTGDLLDEVIDDLHPELGG
ncbi:MAG: ABC transporter substrate-binding protein [Acidimicrobiia bacterium]|nr:ABC transporter substrate-binding protein [Acidimicrobiia bacterium]